MAVSTILALLLTTQVPGASTPAPSPTPAESARAAAGAQIGTAAAAFSACIQPKVATVAPALTPEQGADSVLAACKSEQTALMAIVDTMIASAPADQQAMARKQVADGMTQARTQIADGIRQMRAATPATPPK